MIKISIFLLVLKFLKFSFCANILAIQASPYYSHQKMHFHLLSELINRGHNLTIFSTCFMDFGHKNVTQYVFDGSIEEDRIHSNILEYKLKKMSFVEYLGGHEIKLYYKNAKRQLEHPKIQELVNNPTAYKFDFLILECIACPLLIFADIYNCSFILTYSVAPLRISHDFSGSTVSSSIFSEIYLSPTVHGKLNFFERLLSSTVHYVLPYVVSALVTRHSRFLVAQLFPNKTFSPDIEIMTKRLNLMLTATSHVTYGVEPTVPTHHQIGFLHVEPPKDLKDENVRKFLNESKNGVVVVSLGTVVNDLTEEIFKKFLETFSELPFGVVWKADGEKFKHLNFTKNILTSKWLQLSDILAHPNVKILIGHGGLRTIEEAISREVPMVLIPLSYDQPFNAALQTELKIAAQIDLNNFTKESLKFTILEMTKAEYKKNIKKIKNDVYDRMMTSREVAVENIEHLIKHKEIFHFQNYEARVKSDYSEFIYDPLVFICRILILISIILRYFIG